MDFVNWRKLCEEKDKRIEELEGKFVEIVERLEENKRSFIGGALQTVYYWKGIEEAIEIVKGGGVNERD